MATRRRSSGHHHRPDWEQRLCRVDVALADGELTPAEARERYRAIARRDADELAGGDDVEADAGARADVGEP